MRLRSATIAAALIQVGTAAFVRWLWSISRGSWDGWAWLTYLVGFWRDCPDGWNAGNPGCYERAWR